MKDCIDCYFWDLFCTLGNVFQRHCIRYDRRHFKEKRPNNKKKEEK